MGIRLEQNFDLGASNTFGVAARARAYIRITDDADWLEAITHAQAHAGSRGIFVLGGGSNVILTQDYDGCVLHVATRGMKVLAQNVVEAAAGESWHQFVVWAIGNGQFGLENLSLIPGTVGAAPIQNIGAYGVELKSVFHSCDAISRETGAVRRFSLEECAFGYRDSLFKHFIGREWIIKRVRLKLSPTQQPKVDYADLRAELLKRQQLNPTPMQVSEAVQGIRMRKLPDPVLLGNAGSFFKNPVIRAAHYDQLRTRFPEMPGFPDTEDWIKVPAAWLIEQCGFKGTRRGDAGVHENHALVLVNYGNATGHQIWALGTEIMGAVNDKFSIALEPEPVIL